MLMACPIARPIFDTPPETQNNPKGTR